MKKKFSILFPTISAVLASLIALSGYLVFKNFYYLEVYIDGVSMQPSLNTEYSIDQTKPEYSLQKNVEYGFVEQSKDAISKIKKFDIITAYYPWDNKDYSQPYSRNSKINKGASFKIKRVIALPNETFKIDSNVIYYKENGEWVTYDLPFERKLNVSKVIPEMTLASDEYFVMGDNYGNSNDCSSNNTGSPQPIYVENIKGVLVSVKGTCDVKTIRSNNKVEVVNKKAYPKARIYF